MPITIFPGKLLILCWLLSIRPSADLLQAPPAETPAIRWAASLDEALGQAWADGHDTGVSWHPTKGRHGYAWFLPMPAAETEAGGMARTGCLRRS